MRKHALVNLVSSILLVLLVAQGCSTSSPGTRTTVTSATISDSDGQRVIGPGPEGQPAVVTWEGYEAEFHSEAQRLVLAPTYVWPSSPPLSKYDPDDGRLCLFEVGCGIGDADGYWFATWEQTWLSSLGVDPVAAEEALSRMLSLPETPLYNQYSDRAQKEHFDDILQQAALGKTQLVVEDVSSYGVTLVRGFAP